MAKAPRPGVGARKEAERTAQKVMTITIHREVVTAKGRVVPESHTLAPGNIPMREQIICRKATGLPFSAFWSENAIGLDSVVVLWWMARRLNGEATLTFERAAEEFPLDLEPHEVDVSVDDGAEEGDELGEDVDPEG